MDALFMAKRGFDVELYEMRSGKCGNVEFSPE